MVDKAWRRLVDQPNDGDKHNEPSGVVGDSFDGHDVYLLGWLPFRAVVVQTYNVGENGLDTVTAFDGLAANGAPCNSHCDSVVGFILRHGLADFPGFTVISDDFVADHSVFSR